jgi:hypothetical protein
MCLNEIKILLLFITSLAEKFVTHSHINFRIVFNAIIGVCVYTFIKILNCGFNQQILPQKLSEKSFWVKVQEEKLASPDILNGLAQKFSSKPPAKKMDDVVDKYVRCLYSSLVAILSFPQKSRKICRREIEKNIHNIGIFLLYDCQHC